MIGVSIDNEKGHIMGEVKEKIFLSLIKITKEQVLDNFRSTIVQREKKILIK